MKALIMTSMYPTPANPVCGTFIRTQVECLKKEGVDVELLLLRGRFRKWDYARAIVQLRREIARGSIDVVHAHYGFVGMVARTQWNLPVVVTYHGGDLMGLVVNDRGGRAWSGPVTAAGGRVLARSIDASIVQSVEMANLLDAPNVFVIPHEVDFDVFHPLARDQARAALGLQADRKYLLFAAHPTNWVKRFSLAQAVAEALSARDASIELLVVYKEPQARLALYMNACDALVFPSYMEGSPNVVKQAMACNLPIVATDVGDVREIIGKTQGCYVCRPDIQEFVRALDHILVDRARTRGHEHVRHLAGPAVAQQIIQVYEHVLRNGRTRTVTEQRPALPEAM